MRFAPLLVLVVACGGGGSGADAKEGTGAVVSLQAATFAKPEVGRVGPCTATLIGTNALLTASSCLAYVTADAPADRGSFIVETAPGVSSTFAIDRIHSFGLATEDGVALAHLARAVPADVASPLALADHAPLRDEPVSAWTYACGGADGKTSSAYRYQSDSPPDGCAGSPRVTAEGKIFEIVGVRTASTPMGSPSATIDVVARRAELDAQLAAWAR